jgi:hypothetical protein
VHSYGVREHGMTAIANGMFAYGATRPFVATFLNFIGYVRNGTASLCTCLEYARLSVRVPDVLSASVVRPLAHSIIQ